MNPSHTATVQGSLRWLAPEFINPTPQPIRGSLTPRDIYAFGCTVFEVRTFLLCNFLKDKIALLQLLTGQPPFSHHNLDISVAIDVLQGIRPVLPPDAISQDAVSKSIRTLLDLCWSENITKRPAAQRVLESLNHVQNLLCPLEQDIVSNTIRTVYARHADPHSLASLSNAQCLFRVRYTIGLWFSRG